MPTNENIVDPLVQQILAAGYTPTTPSEWIISALNYLYGAGGGAGLAAVLGVSNDAGGLGITNLNDLVLTAITLSADGSFDFATQVTFVLGSDTFEVRTTHVKLAQLQDFANNAAALAGSLVAGDLYYTNVAGDGVVKIVL